jgi:hypothetical protein
MKAALPLLFVLVVACALRATTFAIPHFGSDEPAHEGLAVSLLASGGRTYSIRHVGLDEVGAPRDGIALVRLRPDARERAEVLGFYTVGDHHWGDDRAVSGRSPLYPVVLAASIAAFGSSPHAYVVAIPGGGLTKHEAHRIAVKAWHPDWARAQAPTVLPSFLASLGAVALATFAASRRSVLGALVAGLALATSPLEAWAAHRVTADTLVELLGGAAALALAASVGREGRLRPLLSGLLVGLAILAKPSGALLLPAAFVAEALLVLRTWRSGEHPRPLVRAAALRLALVVGATIVAGLWWPLLRLVTTGDLGEAIGYAGFFKSVHQRPEAMVAWPRFVTSRPWHVIASSLAVLSPVLALGGAGLVARAARFTTTREKTGEKTDHARAAEVALAVIVVVDVIAATLWPAQENRYLLPAYVPLAVGAGIAWDFVAARARGHGAKAVLLAIALLACGVQGWLSPWSAASVASLGDYELCPVGPHAPGS